MWIALCLVTLIWLSKAQDIDLCDNVIQECQHDHGTWTRESQNLYGRYLRKLTAHTQTSYMYKQNYSCYEDRIMTCIPKGRSLSIFTRLKVNSWLEAAVTLPYHEVQIPSSALRKSKGIATEEEVLLVATVISSTLFKSSRVEGKSVKGRTAARPTPRPLPGTVLGESVLVVRAGNVPLTNLSQPVRLTFRYNIQVANGTCVFWQESGLQDGTGHWSADGCDTSKTREKFICSCNHLSFFAVLVNPVLSVEKSNAVVLSYITYIGSALSVFFTVISLIIYTYLQRRRPEKAIGVHMQLTAALLCLHLTFLLCSHLVGLLDVNEEGWVCQVLGLTLHWSLLATFSWTALEGFHLYLLLVRVFNIYVRRYLLKLSLVGWGLPTLAAVVCGISGVYGKYSLKLRDDNNSHNSTAQICWLSSQFPQRLLVSYITTVAFPCLVILANSCMLGLVLFKLWGLRRGSGGGGSSSGWKKMSKENGSRLWKDCVTVLGLSCVLGLPWGLAGATYISLPGIYVFTILNSLQGVFMFLWSLALICKSPSDNNSSVRDSSSQKMMTTSFSN